MEVKAREVLKVRALAGEFSYDEASKMAGKKYRRFTYGGKAFIAPSDDSFCSSFDNGDVFSVDLDTNEEGKLSLTGFTTNQQELKMAKTVCELESITVENYKPSSVAQFEELA
jgi:hypothetical protein